MQIDHKLEGGALYYVLFSGVVFSLISAALLTLAQLLGLEAGKVERKQQVQRNLHSGIELVLSETPPCATGDSSTTDLFGQGRDSVKCWRKPWGMFEVAYVAAFTGAERQERTFFIGEAIPPGERITLFLEDRNRPLSLCGNTVIEGTCYLPKAGVKRAYIEGKTFEGEQLVDGEVKTTAADLPGLVDIKAVKDFFDLVETAQGEAAPSPVETPVQRVSFREEPVFLNIPEGMQQGVKWCGQLAAFTPGRIIIDSTCRLEDAIVVASAIRIGEGFKGSGQFFATDSIIIEKGVHLLYPSALLLKKSEPAGEARLILENGSKVEGLVALVLSNAMPNNRSLLSIGAGATVEGLVYTNAATDHKGVVHGMLYAQRFLLSTPSSVYENHLLDATISSVQLHHRFAFPGATQLNGQRTLMKWVY